MQTFSFTSARLPTPPPPLAVDRYSIIMHRSFVRLMNDPESCTLFDIRQKRDKRLAVGGYEEGKEKIGRFICMQTRDYRKMHFGGD